MKRLDSTRLGMLLIDRLTVARALVGTNLQAAWLMAGALNAAADDDGETAERLARQVVLVTCGPKHPMYGAML